MQRLHSHAFYLYGVVVALAIREVLLRVGTHAFVPVAGEQVESWKIHLEALRLVLFLIAITCFYFGSGVFFDKVYINPDTAREFQKKNYGLDFTIGLIHFLIFFAWSLTITNHSRNGWGLSPFFGFLSAIFLYDLVWLIANVRYDSLQEIKLWAFMSALVFFVGAVGFFVARSLLNNDAVAEEISFLIFGLYLVGDAAELFSGRPFFSELIKSLLPRGQA